MSKRDKLHGSSIGSVWAEEEELVPIRYLLVLFMVLSSLLFVAAHRWPGLSEHRARLEVTWKVERGDYVYRLRGRYSIASVEGDFTTSVANDAASGVGTSYLYVPTGLYRVTLEPGYTLERSTSAAAVATNGMVTGDAPEAVPASLVSPNPALVLAKEGRVAPLGLSLIDMPGTAASPEATCMNGS